MKEEKNKEKSKLKPKESLKELEDEVHPSIEKWKFLSDSLQKREKVKINS